MTSRMAAHSTALPRAFELRSELAFDLAEDGGHDGLKLERDAIDVETV
jgi:hypothetical protein